jgi:hypothetical protein
VTPLLLAALVLAAPEPPPRDKLRFGLEYRWWGRNLQFKGDDTLVGNAIGPSPTGITFDVQWFPASHFVDDWRANIGITLLADIAPEYWTRLGEAAFRSSTSRMRTGVMYRFPFQHVEPSLSLGFQSFDSTTALHSNDRSAIRPRVPNVSLNGPRVGATLRLLEFWRLTFDVGGGATFLLGTGEVGSQRFFPGAKGNAFDVAVGLAVRTWSFLDVRLGVDFTVHSLTLAPGVTMSDAFYGVSLGLVFKGVPLD